MSVETRTRAANVVVIGTGAAGLRAAIAAHQASAEGWSDLAQALDLRAGVAVAEATLRGALARRESRGCHNRTDFPEQDSELLVNFVARLDDNGRVAEVLPEPVPPVRDELAAWVQNAPHPDLAGRLLE